MKRCLRLKFMMVALIAALGVSARAQYAYPSGYGSWGWGGWGAPNSGGSTAPGDIARGMGAFAAGAGVYSQQSAVARSINADTAARWNQYVYNGAAEAERLRQNRLVADRQGRDKALDGIRTRIRDNPNEGDINRGDALNAALIEISNPSVYLRGMPSAAVKIPGTMVRTIPFQHAASALTASVGTLSRDYAPASLKERPEFQADREALKAAGDQLRKEDKEAGHPKKETLARARTQIQVLREKVGATLAAGSRERREADNYLKALLGLMRMLETPAVDVLLAGVDKRPEVTILDLINFMKAYSLRFGVAETGPQRQAYQELYPLLSRLRDEDAAVSKPGPVAAVRADENAPPPPVEFFSGMEFNDLTRQPAAPAPPGGTGPAQGARRGEALPARVPSRD